MTLKIVCLRQKHMATDFTFMASVPAREIRRAERSLEQALALVGQLENDLTEYRLTSPVARFNASPLGEKIPLTGTALELLEFAQTMSALSGGAFDAFAKSRSEVNSVAGDEFSHQPWAAWNTQTKEIWKLRPGAHLSFGAVGKGFALDKVGAFLAREGLQDFVLNAGGSSIILSGYQAPNTPWPWGWSWEKDFDNASIGLEFCHSSGKLLALGISGLHEQGEHIIDPKRGTKATQLRSALVGHRSAAAADALSTALFVCGADEGAEFLQSKGSECAWAYVDQNSVPTWNGTFQAYWGEPNCIDGASLTLDRQTKQNSFINSGAPCLFLGIVALMSANVHAQTDGEVVDLSALGISTFTPYIVERNSWWILLPTFVLIMVLAHLPFPWNRKSRRGN